MECFLHLISKKIIFICEFCKENDYFILGGQLVSFKILITLAKHKLCSLITPSYTIDITICYKIEDAQCSEGTHFCFNQKYSYFTLKIML